MSRNFDINRVNLDRLLKLSTLPYESTFLMIAEVGSGNDDSLIHVDTPLIAEGKEHSVPPIYVRRGKEFSELQRLSEERYHVLIGGHVHASPKNSNILPYNCGWTLPRTVEWRDYRNDNLNKTPEGIKALAERQEIIDRIIKEPSDEVKEKLARSLINLSPETLIANMININGIDCYITNRVSIEDEEALVQDITSDRWFPEGDFGVHLSYSDFGLKYDSLIYAKPGMQYTPPSAEKFILSVLDIKEAGSIYGVEQFNIKVID